MEEIKELRERVRLLEIENARLHSSCNEFSDDGSVDRCNVHQNKNSSFKGALENAQIERYSRQLLLQGGFGVEGQLKLIESNVIVVGAGGIGSTGTA